MLTSLSKRASTWKAENRNKKAIKLTRECICLQSQILDIY
jgi:hypothetical protein